MIRWLKKLCILWLIGLPILLGNFSSATFSPHWNGVFTPSMLDSNYSLTVFKFWEVYTEYWSDENFVFAPNNDLLFYRNQDSKPFLILPSSLWTQYWWELVNYYFCDPITSSFTTLTNCSSPQVIDYDYLAYFMSQVSANDNWAYEVRVWYNVRYWFDLCFSSVSEWKSLCFWVQSSAYNWFNDIFQSNWSWEPLIWTSAFTWDHRLVYTYTFSNIPDSVIGFSPYSDSNPNIPITWWSVMSWVVYDQITSWDVVRYYEDTRNFDESMCYVWTTDLTSLYEDRIPYDQWSWYTIFDTYSKLYDKSSYKLSEIAEFYSVWIDNFNNWFRWWDTHVIYTYWELPTHWNDLTNPFLNNLAVYYFIWSTFWYSHQTHYNTNWVGMSLSYYCYNKLTNVSNDWSTYNITDDHWVNIDWEVLDKKHNVNHYYSWEYEIVAQSREWTPVDYFSSWSNYTNARDFFNSNFNKFKEVLRPLSPWDLGFWYVPWYIILFMLALILFRFLWH